MSMDGYQLALEQANAERVDIQAQLAKLHARDALIDKLQECLKQLVPQPEHHEHHEHQGGNEHHHEEHHHEEHHEHYHG